MIKADNVSLEQISTTNLNHCMILKATATKIMIFKKFIKSLETICKKFLRSLQEAPKKFCECKP
jgi:hypothetical protein